VKAMWALKETQDIEAVKKIMQQNLANEISDVIPVS
jgi:hypothetical protein